MAAHDILEPGRVERGSDDVVRLGVGVEEHLPAGLPEAVAPVDLFAHEEELLVETADRVHSLPPDEEACAEEIVRLTHRLVIEARAEERVERLGVRRELAQEEVLGGEPPGSRVTANRALERAVGIEEPRSDDAASGCSSAKATRSSSAPSVSHASGFRSRKYRPDAARMPALLPAPKPRFSCSRTRASGNRSRTSSSVPSVEPLSTTIISAPDSRTLSSERSIHGAAL